MSTSFKTTTRVRRMNRISLHVKRGKNGEWKKVQNRDPYVKEFTFRAPHDGEFWFRMVANDKDGRQEPSDLNRHLHDCVVIVVNANLEEMLPMPEREDGKSYQAADIPRTRFDTAKVRLPVEMEDDHRRRIKSVELYMKHGAKGTWKKLEETKSDVTEFEFQAPHDGEYWFHVVTVDRNGRRQPADLDRNLIDAAVIVVNANLEELLPMPKRVGE